MDVGKGVGGVVRQVDGVLDHVVAAVLDLCPVLQPVLRAINRGPLGIWSQLSPSYQEKRSNQSLFSDQR